MRTRDFQHKRAQKTKSVLDGTKCKESRNKTTRLIRESKRSYYSEVINANKKDSGKLWKTLKSIISRSKKSRNLYFQKSLNVLSTLWSTAIFMKITYSATTNLASKCIINKELHLNYVTLKFRSTYRFLWGHELANSFRLLRLHSSFLQMINFSCRQRLHFLLMLL